VFCELEVVVLPLTVKLPVITTLALLIVVVPVAAPREIVVAAPPMFSVVTVELNIEAVVLVVVIAGEAPLRANDVALVAVIVGLPIVSVPVEAPIETAVAAPNKAPVNALVLNTEAVPVEVVVSEGDAPFIVNEVALGFANVTLLTVNVPVDAPNVVAVEAPNAFTVVKAVLNSVRVPVDVEAIVGETPLMLRAVALVNVTVGLAIVAVPVEAPRANVVAAPPMFSVVATVLYKF